MDIRPIRTDEDHAWALARITELWQAEYGTPEHDELEVLVVLAEDYEQRRWPIIDADRERAWWIALDSRNVSTVCIRVTFHHVAAPLTLSYTNLQTQEGS